MAGQVQKVERVEGAALAVITSTEIDRQVATARQYPRKVKQCLEELRALVTSSEEVALECFYTLERKEKDKETGRSSIKFIVGPSVRFAELLVYCWTNLRVAVRIVEEGAEFLTAQGIAHDLERNNAVSAEVRRRITTSQGHRYGADMIGVTGAAASSIAWRNAVFDLIPPAVWRSCYEAARAKAVGDKKTLSERIAAAIGIFVKAGAVEAQIYPALGIAGKDELTEDHLILLRGLWTRVRDKEIDAAKIFAPEAREERQRLGLLSEDGPDNKPLGDGGPDEPDQVAQDKPAEAAGGRSDREPADGPSPAKESGDKGKGKAKAAKSEAPKDPPQQETAGKAEEDPDQEDRELVLRIDREVAAIKGGGKSQPIRDNRGALERIKETAADQVLRKHADKLLNMFDLDA